MPNITVLKRKAKTRAIQNGHQMTNFQACPTDGTKAASWCVDCGMGVNISVYPKADIFGSAINHRCDADIEEV